MRCQLPLLTLALCSLASFETLALHEMHPNDDATVESSKGLLPSPGDTREVDIGDEISVTLVWCPAGEFTMGSPNDEKGRFAREGPLSSINIARGFWMCQTEVTVGQFRSFVSATGYKTTAEREGWAYAVDGRITKKVDGMSWLNPGFEQTDAHPVVCVSWDDATAYCKWLTDSLPGNYRLPTEAQWEFACRAGTTTAFAFDDPESQLDQYMWHTGNSGKSPRPVGEKNPNPWGLHDMHGNAWEWCRDVWHKDYQGVPDDGSAWMTGGMQERRVLRGGCWNSGYWHLRSANRYGNSTGLRGSINGFRFVMDPQRAISPTP